MQSKNIVRVGLVTGLLLLIPLIAMQFTNEVDWTLLDFVFAGTLIFSIGIAYEFVATRGGNGVYRSAAALGLGATFLLIWINAAVGIIGDGPVNLLYLVVVAVGILGTILVRLQANGMMFVLFSMALVQLTIPVIALLIFDPSFSPGVLAVFVLNAMFAAVFIASGLLFRRVT